MLELVTDEPGELTGLDTGDFVVADPDLDEEGDDPDDDAAPVQPFWQPLETRQWSLVVPQ